MALVAEPQSGAYVAPKAEGIPVASRSHFDLKKLQLLHKNLTSNRSNNQNAISDEADGLNEDLGNLNFLQNFNKTTIVKPVASATPMKILQDGGFLNNNSPISLRKILLETPKKGGKKEGVQKVNNTKSVIGNGNIVCLERNGSTVEINMEAVCSRMMEIGSDSDEEICDSVLLEETVHSCEDDIGENPVMENPAIGNSNKENFLGNFNKENASLGNLVPKVEKDEIKQDKKVKIGSIKEEFDEELTDLKWLQDINLLKNIKTGDWSMCRSPPTNQHSDPTNDAFDHEMLPNYTWANSCLTEGSYNPFRHASTKPPYSFSCLIFMAIEDSSEKKLPVKEIYRWVQNSFPFYRNAPTGWKNSVRHNLSLNKCFMKVDKDRGEGIGKGSYWCVHPHYRPNLLQALRRTPYHPFHQMQMISGGGGVNTSSLQQLSPSSSGLQSAGSDMDDIEIPIPDTTDIDVAHTLMQMRLEARRADLAARIARVAVGLDGAVESSSVRAALSLAALLEGLEEHDDRTMLYEKLRHTHRDGDDQACTPHPSTDHSYSVTDDVIQAALLISPASSIDHDYDFYNDDDDDDDYDDDFFNNEPIDLTKKKKPEILSRNSRAGKSPKLGKTQNSRHLKKGNRKQKLSVAVKKPVSKKAPRKTTPGVRRGISWDGEVSKSPGKSPKKSDLVSSDAEALDGAGALLQLCLNAAGNSQREAPGGEKPLRKKRLTVKERERQVRERAAELEDIRDEVDFIRSCTRGVSPHKSGNGTMKGGDGARKAAGNGNGKGKRREIEDDDDDSMQATYGSCSGSYVEEVVTRADSGGEGSTKRRPKPNEKFREFFATKAKKSKLDIEDACSGAGKQNGKKSGSSTLVDKKALGKSNGKTKNKRKKDLIEGKKGGAFGSDATGAEIKMECDYQEGEIIGEIKIEVKEEPMD